MRGEVAAVPGQLLHPPDVEPRALEDRLALELEELGRDRVLEGDGARAQLGVVARPGAFRRLREAASSALQFAGWKPHSHTLRMELQAASGVVHTPERWERRVESPWSAEPRPGWGWRSPGTWRRAATRSACSTCRARPRSGRPRSCARRAPPRSPWSATSPTAAPSTRPSRRCARSSDPSASWSPRAGLDAFEGFADVTVESWERVLAVNLTGTFHCLQAAVPDMLEARWGRMVTISSSSAQSGAPRMAHYVASKAGVIGLTKALALELAPHGITVNNVPPGIDRHADAAPRRGRAATSGRSRRWPPGSPSAGPEPPRTSRRRAGSSAPTRRASSPARWSASTAAWSCERSGGARMSKHTPKPKVYPKPPEGTWTEHYPELGTAPVSYESSISPEFYELEREAIFKRAWLNVGRVEQLKRNGSFFTKDLAVAKTSLIVVRGMDGEIRAFHNVCRHRGNKLAWTDDPRVEIEGHLPAVLLQVPRLAVRPRRQALVHPPGGRVLRDRQGRLRPRLGALRGVAGVHLREPRQGAEPVAPRLPRPDDHRDRLPVPQRHRALLLPRRHPQQLEGLPRRLPGVLSPAHPPRPAEPGDVERGVPADGLLHDALPDRRPASRGLHERRRRRRCCRRKRSIPSRGCSAAVSSARGITRTSESRASRPASIPATRSTGASTRSRSSRTSRSCSGRRAGTSPTTTGRWRTIGCCSRRTSTSSRRATCASASRTSWRRRRSRSTRSRTAARSRRPRWGSSRGSSRASRWATRSSCAAT